MNESKKTVAAKRKLTLHRETLRAVDEGALKILDGVVGGTGGLGDTDIPGTTLPPTYRCGVVLDQAE